VEKFAAGVVDTGGKFATGVVENGGNFAAGVVAIGVPFNLFSLQEKDEEEEDEEDEEEEEDAVEAVTEALNDQLMRQKKERGQEERTASMAASFPAPKSILKHSDSSFGLHSPDSLNDDVQVPKLK
jgi:hypothetical protein